MNLIICTTPLQMIIAEKIIQLFPNEQFHLVIITPFKNNKYNYYYKKIKERCARSDYIRLLPLNKSKLFTLIDLLRLRLFSFLLPRYDKIFLANIENIWIQTFLSRFDKRSNIYTYDDGTANIIGNNYLYEESALSLFSRFILKLIGNKFSLSKFKKITQGHFTIYKGIPNIVDNTQYISLYTHQNLYKKDDIINTKRIFLGQPIYQFDIDLNSNIEKIINKYSIELYFPHPREEINKYDNITYIETELIFEDYLISKLNSEPNTKFIIFTLYSGAVLNVYNFDNVEVIAIKPQNTPKNIENIFKIFNQLGIYILTI